MIERTLSASLARALRSAARVADESTADASVVTSIDGRRVARQVLRRVPPERTLSLGKDDG